MKAKVFEIKKFAVHDGDGIRTTIFFKGCPLKCVWCHNPEGLSSKTQLAYYSHKCINCFECVKICPNNAHIINNGIHEYVAKNCINCGKCEEICLGNAIKIYGKDYTVDELLKIVLEDKVFYDNSGGGVTLSGGECLLYANFIKDLFIKLKNHGINTAVDTCGFIGKDQIDKIIDYTDVFLYDFKAYTSKTHKNCTGQSNDIIIKNLEYLDKKGKNIEIRIPYVPNYNDFEIEDMIKYLNGIKNITKIRILPYHNFSTAKYQSLNYENTMPSVVPTNEEIENIKNTLRKISIHKIVD
ncbi:MAG: glycyl-radical enzyme activating protein [Clostridia bacterium]|nr:glycyl-radical enzyme activating protein [Clostridia bacterium]